MGIQQMLLGVGTSKKTYLDDVFSTYLYTGTGSAITVNNGIDLATEGGLVWTKSRQSENHGLGDTINGTGKVLVANSTGDLGDIAQSYTAFNNNGYTIGNDWIVNRNSSYDYASWTFRKAKGFFDVVKYTGNGSNRTIAHSLGSIPGCIIIKNLDSTEDWRVYHRSLGGTHNLVLNSGAASAASSSVFNNTDPTASVFSVGTSDATNKNGDEFVAYVFAGGESTAATARSVDFDASGDYLTTDQSADFAMGTGDFTVEGWFKWNDQGATNFGYFMNHGSGLNSTYGVHVAYQTLTGLNFYASGSSQSSNYHPPKGQWFHLALVRNSGTTSLYINGILKKAASDTTNYGGERFIIGGYHSGSFLFSGMVSNFRVVKGTAVYTSAFKPTTKPLTSISGTVLLCCNNSSNTGSTTGGTLTADGDPTASTDSPFYDPAAFKFGESKEGIIKCGSYKGNASATGPEINLGWEPQFLIIKGNTDWHMVDSMRGILTGGNEPRLFPNGSGGEAGQDIVDLTPTGFKVTASSAWVNADGVELVYIAIRRPDGYVGKPAEVGTDVFAMDTGAGVTTIPNFDSTFPVDFAMMTTPATAGQHRRLGARLMGPYEIKTNSTGSESGHAGFTFDSNVGWGTQGDGNTWQSWMWKRHAGLDIVTVKSAATGDTIPHSLGRTPEMIWAKNRDNSGAWSIYHKDLNGGTNPEQYRMMFDTDAETTNEGAWNNSAPTSTHFTSGANFNGNNPIFYLFSSVDGICKVGSYTGNGSTGQTITTGFQPRFVIIRRRNGVAHWLALDTTRGWGSGDDKYLLLNGTGAQGDYEVGAPVSNGFTLVGDNDYNNSSGEYIYYAHA